MSSRSGIRGWSDGCATRVGGCVGTSTSTWTGRSAGGSMGPPLHCGTSLRFRSFLLSLGGELGSGLARASPRPRGPGGGGGLTSAVGSVGLGRCGRICGGRVWVVGLVWVRRLSGVVVAGSGAVCRRAWAVRRVCGGLVWAMGWVWDGAVQRCCHDPGWSLVRWGGWFDQFCGGPGLGSGFGLVGRLSAAVMARPGVGSVAHGRFDRFCGRPVGPVWAAAVQWSGGSCGPWGELGPRVGTDRC